MKSMQSEHHNSHKIGASAESTSFCLQKDSIKYGPCCGTIFPEMMVSCVNSNQSIYPYKLTLSPLSGGVNNPYNFRKFSSRRWASSRLATYTRATNPNTVTNTICCTAQYARKDISYSIWRHSRKTSRYQLEEVINQLTRNVGVIHNSRYCHSHRLAIASVASVLSISNRHFFNTEISHRCCFVTSFVCYSGTPPLR